MNGHQWREVLHEKGLVIGSRNPGKLREFDRLLSPLGIKLHSLDDVGFQGDVEETADTFTGNALLKAQAYAKFSSLPALADDSGLIVDALGGEPGVYSARYGGKDLDDIGRYELVLKNLDGVPEEKRTARYMVSLIVALPSGEYAEFQGTVEGHILTAPVGEGGFGYDPIFFHNELGKTFAQITGAEKDTLSHRGRAMQKLVEFLNL